MGKGVTAIFERAVFSDAQRASYRSRWILFVVLLLLLAGVYAVARDILYLRLVHGYAQSLFNDLASASVESIGHVSVDHQGDVTLHRAEAYTHRRGERRLFFRTERLRLTLDGTPLRDANLRVMRVDLFQPEIHIRREVDGEWNVEWAFQQAPRAEELPKEGPKEDPWKDYLRPDESFPRNGVYIHDGTIHVTFAAKGGADKDVTWSITAVSAMLSRRDGILALRPCRGDFYGGTITADAELLKTSPFTLRQMTVDVRDAQISRLVRGETFVKNMRAGKLNGVISLTADKEKLGGRPVAAGYAEITQGDLWDLPAFSGILHLLTLTAVSDRRIDTGILEFTVEEDQIRIDKMHFLGYPVSLFGDGACSLTGDWMEIVFYPRLGKSDWNSILPIIGAPIDLLSNIFKGVLTPLVLKGSFEKPEFTREPLHFLKPSVKTLIEEKSPR